MILYCFINTAISCGEKPNPPNAYYVTSEQPIRFTERESSKFYYSDRLTYTCDDRYHYRRSTVFTITCGDDGRYSEAVSGCVCKYIR